MTTYPAIDPNNRWRPFSNQRWSTSQAQGIANRKPYPAMCSRRKWSRSTASMSTFNTDAIAKGDAINNRLVQPIFMASDLRLAEVGLPDLTRFKRLVRGVLPALYSNPDRQFLEIAAIRAVCAAAS